MQEELFAFKLFDKGIIRFGEFTLKSGITSPFYIDMRKLCAYPTILKSLAVIIAKQLKDKEFKHICGVPYAALALSSLVAQELNIPQILMRKEQKKYGTKKMLEGVFKRGDEVVLIDDVITSGISFIESANKLEAEALVPSLLLSIIDREQGGSKNLDAHHYPNESIFKISELAQILNQHQKITDLQYQQLITFINKQKVSISTSTKNINSSIKIRKTYKTLAQESQHPFNKKLLQLIQQKKSNLCFSADINDKTKFLETVKSVAPHIVILKTHIDIISNFDTEFIAQLKLLRAKHNFLILEDRKFADIGNTVYHQYYKGIYKIATWADAITVHAVAGAASVKALSENKKGSEQAAQHSPAIILISQMSTVDTLTDEAYQEKVVAIAKQYSDVVVGIVSQSKQALAAGQLHLTPGIKLTVAKDAMGQQYDSPAKAFREKGTDVIIVGRGIYQSENPQASATHYQRVGWEAYLAGLNGLIVG